MKKIIGLSLILATVLVIVFHTEIFGKNFFPQSPFELFLRLASLATLNVGIFLLKTKRRVF